jgi:hypothetical protein
MSILNDSLNEVLDGLSAEEAAEVMTELNSIDKMDINAWEGLSYTFE